MKDKIRRIVMFILVLIIFGCAGYLAWYYLSVPDEEDARQVVEEYTKPDREESDEPVEIPIDFDALQAVNPDVYAWIKIEGTHIDYPVVQNALDGEYYLNHTWEGAYAESGAIFTQSCNAQDFSDYNTVIYGHRMGNGNETMFHDLHNYMDMEYQKEHQDIVIYTRDHVRTYKVFAAVVYDDRLIPASFDFSSKEGRSAFLESVYTFDDMRNQFADNVKVSSDDRLITLSTCLASEPHHRFLLGAVLIDEK